MIEIYTDGSCRNDGSGGYALVIVGEMGTVDIISNSQLNTTNNRMEMQAIIDAFKLYGKREKPYNRIYTDSQYSINTFSKWMFSWRTAWGTWIKSNGTEPENIDLIEEFYKHYLDGYRIEFVKVEGHSGDVYNEMADKAATEASEKLKLQNK